MKSHDSAQAYVDLMAKLMGLGQWEVRVSRDIPASDENNAQVDTIRGQLIADIYLGKSLFSLSPDEQRYVVVHELIHVHFGPSDWVAKEAMDDKAHAAWDTTAEYSVDALARAISPFYPLPGVPVNAFKPNPGITVPKEIADYHLAKDAFVLKEFSGTRTAKETPEFYTFNAAHSRLHDYLVANGGTADHGGVRYEATSKGISLSRSFPDADTPEVDPTS